MKNARSVKFWPKTPVPNHRRKKISNFFSLVWKKWYNQNGRFLKNLFFKNFDILGKVSQRVALSRPNIAYLSLCIWNYRPCGQLGDRWLIIEWLENHRRGDCWQTNTCYCNWQMENHRRRHCWLTNKKISLYGL